MMEAACPGSKPPTGGGEAAPLGPPCAPSPAHEVRAPRDSSGATSVQERASPGARYLLVLHQARHEVLLLAADGQAVEPQQRLQALLHRQPRQLLLALQLPSLRSEWAKQPKHVRAKCCAPIVAAISEAHYAQRGGGQRARVAAHVTWARLSVWLPLAVHLTAHGRAPGARRRERGTPPRPALRDTGCPHTPTNTLRVPFVPNPSSESEPTSGKRWQLRLVLFKKSDVCEDQYRSYSSWLLANIHKISISECSLKQVCKFPERSDVH